jgi:hypothetical protein
LHRPLLHRDVLHVLECDRGFMNDPDPATDSQAPIGDE